MMQNVKRHANKRYQYRTLLLIISLLSIAILSSCNTTPEPTASVPDSENIQPLISISGKLVPETWTTVHSNTGGTISHISVETGESVKAGDELVQFVDDDLHFAYFQAETAVDSARANLSRLTQGPSDEEIALAEAQVLAAQATLSQTIAAKNQLFGGQYEADLAAAEANIQAMQEVQFNANLVHDDTMKCVNVEQPDGSSKQVCPALGRLEEQARYALNTANYQLEAAQAQRDALKTSYYKQLAAADAAINVAESQLHIAEQQLALLLSPVNVNDKTIAQLAVKQAELQYQAAESAWLRMTVRAPIDGTVVDIDLHQGEYLLPGVPIITIGDLDSLYIETTDLDEIDVARVQIGQKVVVTFEALPDITFTGTLTDIALINSATGSGVSYTAHVALDQVDPRLRWGMTAFIDIAVQD